MSEKTTIKKIYRSTKDKEGKPLKTKDGRDYERVAFKCEKYGDKWVSGFGNYKNEGWQEGDEIEVIIEEVGQYINFRMPSSNVSRNEFDLLVARVQHLDEEVFGEKEIDVEGEENESRMKEEEKNAPPEEIDVKDIPF